MYAKLYHNIILPLLYSVMFCDVRLDNVGLCYLDNGHVSYSMRFTIMRIHGLLYYLGSTSSTDIPILRAMSSAVPLPGEMIPTALAMALAVMGWSPVTMMTLMPASRHLLTASGTFGRGGSIIDIKPTNRRPDKGKFSSSALNSNPMGN